MMFSKTVVHGVYILCYLSRQEPGTVVPAAAIAEAMEVPPEQAAKILQALANAGMVSSARGRRGGYAMAKSSDDITMADLIDALGPTEDQAQFGKRSCPVMPGAACSAHAGLMQFHERMRDMLSKETLTPVISATCSGEMSPFQDRSRSPKKPRRKKTATGS